MKTPQIEFFDGDRLPVFRQRRGERYDYGGQRLLNDFRRRRPMTIPATVGVKSKLLNGVKGCPLRFCLRHKKVTKMMKSPDALSDIIGHERKVVLVGVPSVPFPAIGDFVIWL
jgi:hypothetical protein